MPKCAVIGAGRSDLVFDRYFFPDLKSWTDQILTGDINDDKGFEQFMAMSPLFRMNKVHIPVLLYVGDRDLSWLPEMLMEFNALRELGKDVTLVRYTEEEHSMSDPDDVQDFVSRVHAFFDINLKAAPMREGSLSYSRFTPIGSLSSTLPSANSPMVRGTTTRAAVPTG